jgi:hypothetical protein
MTADCLCNTNMRLQVSSSEMLFSNTIEFGYNTDLARAVHARDPREPREPRGSSQAVPYRPQTPSYTCGPSLMPLNHSLLYRNQPISDYQYQQKTSCYLPPFNGDFNEDGLDYTLSAATYPLYGSESLGGPSSCVSQGTSHPWMGGNQSARGSTNGVYFESEAATYGSSQMRYNSQLFGLRSSLSSEPNHFSFSSMASSLPTPSPNTTNDRILPIPSRTTPALAPLHRVTDDLSYSGNAIKAVGAHPFVASQLITGGQSTSLNYLPHSGSHDSADAYNSHGLAGNISQHQADLYSPSDNWAPAALTNDPALRPQESSSDLYYSHSSDGARKASQSGQSSISSISSTLSNGHSYQAPYHPEKPQVPRTSPMDTSRRATRRRSNASLRAA